jgi:hypothetical protein
MQCHDAESQIYINRIVEELPSGIAKIIGKKQRSCRNRCQWKKHVNVKTEKESENHTNNS